MLALKVEYLTGVCMATKHDDPDRRIPEWPPHPDRVYSALVAAAAKADGTGETSVNNAAQEVLQWLLKQGAPQLYAGEALCRTAPDVHMPSNPHEDEVWQKPKTGKPRLPKKSFDLRSLLPVHRKKTALPIPAVVPDEPVAYFLWPDTEANGQLRVLRDICERVTYLGRSRSLVRVTVVNSPPPPTHVPDKLGQVQLRVPGTGRLEYLLDKHKRDGGKPEPCPPHRYRRVDGHRPLAASLQPIFDRMYIFKAAKGDPALPAVATMKLTQALRAALIKWVEADQRERGVEPHVPDIVHGHGKHPHCAYVALPFVHPWQRHADGSIKGVAVVVPRDVSGQDLTELACGLIRLQANGLGIPGIGPWHIEEVPADNPPMATLDVETWTKPSSFWTTATPMVFGHFPKPSKGGEAKVIIDSLEMIGVDRDRVMEIAVSQHSPLHGASPSWCFKARRNDSNSAEPHRWVRHVTLRFDRPVSGPLLLGCKRYFGLGLMRPLEE